jgi:hypothetical protein
MDLTLREEYLIRFFMKLIAVISCDNTTASFIALRVNWCNNKLLPLIREFFLIPNRIYKLSYFRICVTKYFCNLFCFFAEMC